MKKRFPSKELQVMGHQKKTLKITESIMHIKTTSNSIIILHTLKERFVVRFKFISEIKITLIKFQPVITSH